MRGGVLFFDFASYRFCFLLHIGAFCGFSFVFVGFYTDTSYITVFSLSIALYSP